MSSLKLVQSLGFVGAFTMGALGVARATQARERRRRVPCVRPPTVRPQSIACLGLLLAGVAPLVYRHIAVMPLDTDMTDEKMLLVN